MDPLEDIRKAFLEEVNGSENEAWEMDLISAGSDFKLTETPSSKNHMSKDIPETEWKCIGSESHDVKLQFIKYLAEVSHCEKQKN